MAKGFFIGVGNFKKRDLPSGYTQVEYIESTGTQYIDTGFYPKYNSRVVMDISNLSDDTTQWLFGSRDSGSSTAANQFCLYRNAATTVRADYFGANASTTISDMTGRTVAERNGNIVSIFGATITNTAVTSGECTYPMYLFTLNNAGTAHSNKASMRMYSCQVYDNELLVRDFVPCVNSSGSAGLYDVVSGVFYSNAGSGTFTASTSSYSSIARKVKEGFIGIGGTVLRKLPEGYTQLEYIESTGSQYIDTGICPNQSTRLDMRFTLLSGFPNKTEIFGARNSAEYFELLFYESGSMYLQFGTQLPYKSFVVGDFNISLRDGILYDGNTGSLLLDASAAGSFSITQTLYLFAMHNASGGVERQTKARISDCKIYRDGINLDRDFIPVKNSSGEVGLFDMVTMTFYGDASGVGFVAGSVAVASSGVARRVKEAFIGIGGIARPCWSGGELKYYGTITSLSAARYDLAATSIGNYALFGGGIGSNINNTTVDAYNASLTHSTPTALSNGRYRLAATKVGDYALFGGGHSLSGSSHSYHTTVDAYNTSLTRSLPTSLSSGRGELAAASNGSYALFGGGNSGSSIVDAYNTSLTRSTPTSLSEGRMYLAATYIGNYALFGGGCYRYGGSENYSTVDAYNSSLTRSIPTVLNEARYNLAATSVGDYAIFGGGYNASSKSAITDAYNDSLTRSTPTALSEARSHLAATTIGNYALFGGGSDHFAGAAYTSVVDTYDASLTHSTLANLSEVKYSLAATTVGDYALFGGGDRGSGESEDHSPTVDAYTIA